MSESQSVSISPHSRKVDGYNYLRTTRPITFTCTYCGVSVTQERFPGPTPSYCSDECRLASSAYRKRIARARTGKNKGKRGRPRKNS